MKSILLLICVLGAINVFSQDKYLSITQSGSEKEAVFKENKRVRIKTIQGGKLVGKLHFVDETQVMIKNITIPISSISQIKHNPLLLNVFVSSALIVGGVLSILSGVYIVAWGATFIGIAIGVGGAGILFAGIKSPNFLPSIHINNNSSIKTANVLQ